MNKQNLAAIVASAGLLFTTGCAKVIGGQIQVAYGKGEYFPEKGKLELFGPRSRLIIEDSTGGEFRIGADVLYGKLPKTTSQKTYTVDGPFGISEDTVVDGVTKQSRVKISLPIDYKIPWSFCGNISWYDPEKNSVRHPLKEAGITYPQACDVELSFLLTLGYNIDLTVKETDYSSGTNRVDDIPGIDPAGQVYGEFGHELLLFGRFPVGLSVRVDSNENGTPFFTLGYRIE